MLPALSKFICASSSQGSIWSSSAARYAARAEIRARYLGPNWDLAKGARLAFQYRAGALDVGAAVAGHWSGAHAVALDLDAPPFDDLDVGDRFQKHNYPFGIVVNARGERFLDEGLDFHSYTDAK